MYIGVFDSGLGGATVLTEARNRMPDEDYLYYADSLHVPYGEKPKEEVRRYIFEAVDRMAEQGLKALVIACNTATSIAVKELREAYSFPIIGMEPAVKPAVLKNSGNDKRVLVFATNLTLRESKFQQLVSAVDPKHIVDFMALPGLVELAEKLEFEGPEAEEYLRAKLGEFDLEKYGTVVLGCTHFPLFNGTFRGLLPEGIDLIDGSAGTVRHLQSILESKGLRGGGSGLLRIESSGDCAADERKVLAAARYMESTASRL